MGSGVRVFDNVTARGFRCVEGRILRTIEFELSSGAIGDP
jgi:hypothetical protein